MQPNTDFVALCDETSGQIRSLQLFGEELLDADNPCVSEMWVNGQPLAMHPRHDPNQPGQPHLKGEKWVSHFSGWSLVLARLIEERAGLKHRCFGIQSLVRRELCDASSFLNPGPCCPPVEAPVGVGRLLSTLLAAM